MTTYYLGIDSGGTISKVALFNEDGNEVAVASRPVAISRPIAGWSERDMNRMWNETASAIREVVTCSGISSSQIAGVGCTGHGNGLYLIDHLGQPVRMAINSDDQRAREIVINWQSDGMRETALPKTLQSLWAAQPNALFRWLKENESDSYRRTRWMLMAKDFIRYKLTDVIAGELTDMSALSLMDNTTGKWDPDLFSMWGIDEAMAMMPSIIKSTEIAGHVTSEAAEACGLKVGTPVCGGAFDIDACGLASGMVDQTQFCMVSGTWGNHLFVARDPVVSTEIFMCTPYAIDGWFLHLEGSPSSAGNLEWFIHSFLSRELANGKATASTYQYCDQLFQESKSENSLLFMPFVHGSHTTPNATGAILGIEAWHSLGDILRTVYEAVAFSHRWQMERLLRFTKPCNEIRLTGGVTKNANWVQLFADCFQKTIRIPDANELGALGAAILAAVAVGNASDISSACQQMTRFSRSIEPNPARAEYLSLKYDRYCKSLPHMQSIWNCH